MTRALLVFLAGVLVGANAVYFLMTRDAFDPERTLAMARSPSATAGHDPNAAPANPAGAAGARDGADPTAPGTRRPTGAGEAVPALPPPSASAAPDVAPPAPAPSGLIVPVRGITADRLADTFTDARSAGRVHEALDIMAPRGTPVLAVADGTVEKLFTSDAGGLTIYQFEPSGRYAYYYAHLDRYAAGVVEGKALRRGEVIGYVGSTGNANDDGPHLHFAIFVLGPQRRWWEGTAINPYPVLTGRQPVTVVR